MVLEVRNVNYFYKNNENKLILQNINLQFDRERIYAILGPSGSGKSTLLSLMAGLDVPTDGEILFCEKEIERKYLNKYRKNNISLVFQSYNLIDYLTAEENVRLGGKKDPMQMLEAVGISKEESKRLVLQLSGGQQQRVAIARALASDADILLADEPTGNLDEGTEKEIIKLLVKTAHELKKCVIVVTHSNTLAKQVDEIIRLEKGKITFSDV